jgi:hypothetical protein
MAGVSQANDVFLDVGHLVSLVYSCATCLQKRSLYRCSCGNTQEGFGRALQLVSPRVMIGRVGGYNLQLCVVQQKCG